MKRNIAQFAVEQEGTPGTAETIVLADVLTRLRSGYTITPDHGLFDLDEISAVSSKTPAVIGRKMITFGVTHILRGPGDVTTAPAITDLIEAAMFNSTAAKTIAIGAITGGPFVAGEVITGGTSTATGMVLQQIATGTSPIAYIPITGTMQTAETITGGTSGATTTTSGAPVSAGFGYRPGDSATLAGHCCTCEGLIDGYYWQGRGCLADLQLEFNNGGPCILTQNFLGALSAKGDKALYVVPAYPESDVTPPKFLNAAIYYDTYQPTGIVSLTINWPTNPTPIEDANDASGDGILYCDYNRELPTVTIEVDQILAATYDWYAKLEAGVAKRFEFTHGSTAGSKWTFSAPAAQIRSVVPGERDPNRATFQVELGLTGDNNNELLIWQH